jgi:CRP/FNR family transcriptional regulator, dissimilatory nitrate respiration regulator
MGGRFPVAAETVSPTRLLRIDGSHLRQRIREQPDLALSMLGSMSYHLKFLVEQLEHMKLLTAPQRIADFLIRLCPKSEGPHSIELPYDKALLANRLGMKPESLSRALAKLRQIGVTVDRESVTISSLKALHDFAQPASEANE